MEAFKLLGSSLTKETDEMMMILTMANEAGESKWREVNEGKNRGDIVADKRKRKKDEATGGTSMFLGQGRRRRGKSRGDRVHVRRAWVFKWRGEIRPLGNYPKWRKMEEGTRNEAWPQETGPSEEERRSKRGVAGHERGTWCNFLVRAAKTGPQS